MFDRLAATLPAGDALVWLPGYPPGWWLQAMRHLITLAPAPALIACDPDPDGIAIALLAAALWENLGLSWEPGHMCAADLARLQAKRELSARDVALLDRLAEGQLPPALASLAEMMRASGQKGEQEGLF